ncbi:MAG TPA: NnrU family protein [Candidatus Binatia bacterium]|nr:NnrU family protein [Candidatus Binatia bacterium]
MSTLVLASVFLPLSHVGLSRSRLHELLVRKLGERRYLTLYKLITVAAFGWLITAYRRAPTHVVWITPIGVKLAMLPVVLVAFFLVVAGITTPNPTVVGAESLFDRPDIIRGILRMTRNSFLWGVGLWALTHVVSTGDLASVLMFGSIGALGFIGAPLLDAKQARHHGARWRAFAAATSSLPFLAIAQRRQQLVVAEIGWWRIALAVVLFLAALYGHQWAFGVSLLLRR